jgi:sugar phosphate isomerase/epimerase
LPLRVARSLKEEVLIRPTFFEHFDSVVVDWRYLQERDTEQLKRERAWIDLQGLVCLVDFTSGINLYPDLRLVDNSEPEYAASLAAIAGVMAKMGALEARHLILSLHRQPENNFTRDQTWQSFARTLRRICERAREQQATVHLRLTAGAPTQDLTRVAELAGRVGAPNFRLAPSTALLLSRKNAAAEFAPLKDKVGLWLLSAPHMDVAQKVWDVNAPIRECNDRRALAQILALAPDAPLVFDAVYSNHDEEYLDAKFLREALR